MGYSSTLAERVRSALRGGQKVEEKKMMGGLTFMVNGKMCVGVLREDLMARIDPAEYDRALQKTGCREMNFTGKSMRGFVFVDHRGTDQEKDLDFWINLALDFNDRAKAAKRKGLPQAVQGK